MMLFIIVESEAKLTENGNVKGSRCPFSLMAIKSTWNDPLIVKKPQSKSIWDNFNKIYESIFGRKSSSLDRLNIIPVPTAGKYTDCQKMLPSDNTQCNSSYRYRTFDGTCNNLKHPTWGMSGECQLRFLPASYDGADGFRKSVNGNSLPAPRDLANNICPDKDVPDQLLSHMIYFVGQFVTHDIMQTPTPTRNLDNCCPYNGRNQARISCVPIFLRPDDPFYSRFNRTCMNFERTIDCTRCNKTGEIQKINKATAAIDLSNVYGTNEEDADSLRAKDGTGRLRSDTDDTGEILPMNIGMFSNFCPLNQTSQCFMTGDDRVDQHSTLTSMHTLFLREHNRLATRLKELNPQWKEERLYQEARKIFGGQWQNMIYSEYLPLVLGPRHMTHFGLWVGQGVSRTQYNASARIGIWLEVSTAGFRLHNTLHKMTGAGDLRFYETYSNPGLIRKGCAETLLEGACRVPSQEFGRYFVEDISGFMLKQPTNPDGLDMVSIDIQRGRDNGLPPYTKMVEYLTGGKTKINSFDDLKVLMDQNNIDLLKKNYESVHDVDLFLGIHLEKSPSQSSVGFNSATLSALQFHYLKYGDRFYYEHAGQDSTSFTKTQLKSLRQSSFSRLLCDNTNVAAIQKHALLLPGKLNPIMECNKIAELDLTPWKTNR